MREPVFSDEPTKQGIETALRRAFQVPREEFLDDHRLLRMLDEKQRKVA